MTRGGFLTEELDDWTCETCGEYDCEGHNQFLQLFSSTASRVGIVVIMMIISGVLGFGFGRNSDTASLMLPSSTMFLANTSLPLVPPTNSSLTTSTTTISTTTTTLVVLTNDEKQMIDTVNGERVKTGLLPLEWCPTLARAAKDHSIDMAQRDFYDHVTPEGLEVWDRARNQGYNYSYVGENIAVGQKSVREVMIDWMNSKGHRENILEESYSHFGYGKATGLHDSVPGYIYWTQNFGAGGECK